ncbi:MAG: hypothetical protein IPJ65_16750 [Archangiaceae bacterium]|nr:hypothetical protein [Archangiaceae bacterium]
MSYPPRLGHLMTRAVIAARLRPTYAESHEIDEEEAQSRLERALTGQLWELLLHATWDALNDKKRKVDENAVLEKIAGTLKDRPLRPGRKAMLNPAFSAFLVVIDLEAGTASDAARKVLESPQGEAMKREGIAHAGRFLANELVK